VGIWCTYLHTVTQPSAHLADDNGFKDQVRVNFKDGGECTGGGMVAGMEVTEIEEDGLELRAGVILSSRNRTHM
jgi:hypothetical protein